MVDFPGEDVPLPWGTAMEKAPSEIPAELTGSYFSYLPVWVIPSMMMAVSIPTISSCSSWSCWSPGLKKTD